MKKLTPFAVVLLCLFFSIQLCPAKELQYTTQVFSSAVIPAAGYLDAAEPVNMRGAQGPFGFTLQVVSGGPLTKLEFLLARHNSDTDAPVLPFRTPGLTESDNDLVSGFGTTSGPAADGWLLYFPSGVMIPMHPWITFRATGPQGTIINFWWHYR